MKIDLPLKDGMGLQICSRSIGDTAYPTSAMQRGLALYCDGQDLSEEAVGFGVPILKRGLQAIFPGEVELYPEASAPNQRITARYKLNLEEKISRNGIGSINNRWMYASKNILAAVIRNWPLSRKVLITASSWLRSTFGWKTTYEQADFSIFISMTYTVDKAAGKVFIELNGTEHATPNISEVIVMNEQGAHNFNLYQEAGGRLQPGREIGCWDLVLGESATFISSGYGISFSLPQVKGAKLYRGRELIDSRLAWAGFGYSFAPDLPSFKYAIKLERLT
jgi:hypothetical protein